MHLCCPGKPVFQNVQQQIGMTKWVRCLELFWYAVMFIGNATHHCEKVAPEGGEAVMIPWMAFSTFLIIWGAFKQYVIEAPPDLRLPYRVARQAEMEFRREIFTYIQREKVSFDEAFKAHGYTQLRRLFQYQTGNPPPPAMPMITESTPGTPRDVVDVDDPPPRRPRPRGRPKPKPKAKATTTKQPRGRKSDGYWGRKENNWNKPPLKRPKDGHGSY